MSSTTRSRSSTTPRAGRPRDPRRRRAWAVSERRLDRDAAGESTSSRVALPVVDSRDWDEHRPAAEGEDEEDDFSLSRSGPVTVEELDLAPMVDVAFQLVLFFMVTATTVLYKTLEIPKPSAERPRGAVAQGRSRARRLQGRLHPRRDRRGRRHEDRSRAGRRPRWTRWSSGCGRRARRPAARRCCSRPTSRRRTATRCWPTTRPTRSAWASSIARPASPAGPGTDLGAGPARRRGRVPPGAASAAAVPNQFSRPWRCIAKCGHPEQPCDCAVHARSEVLSLREPQRGQYAGYDRARSRRITDLS